MPEKPEGWEPADGSEWLRADPLAHQQEFEERDVARIYRTAEELSQGLIRLPVALRRQAWREREILAALRQLDVPYSRLPGRCWIGVGKREVDGRRRLVGVISVEAAIPLDSYSFRESLGIPDRLIVPTVLAAAPDPVSIVVEQAQLAARYGIVTPGDWALASSDDAAATIPPLQSGDRIAGEDGTGFCSPGTLTAIVSRKDEENPLLLSTEHVFGQKGRSVLAFQPDGTRVGRVIDSDCGLDAAVAELSEPYHCDYRIKAANIVPAAPVLPTSDMPVQMWGATSSYQRGFIDQSMRIPAGAGRIGMLVPFSARLHSAPGDSGALIVAGHGTAPVTAGTAPLAGEIDTAGQTCAILGMLLAGPDPALRTPNPEVWAVSLIEVMERFNLQVWVRS